MESPFKRTGIHLDLRIQVMPMNSLRKFASEQATRGFNTLLVEWEGTYPFKKHPLIPNTYAYSQSEITGFIRHCQRIGLDVIPLQQCFGHIEYILRHDRYAHLRESQKDLCQLCPCKIDEAAGLFSDLFDELSATHTGDFLHIGGDETYLLGHCPVCREKAAQTGPSALYVDYFKRIAELVIARGKRPILWADMLLKYPEAAADMPRECVFMDWNYGWQPNHFGDLDRLKATGLEFWGAASLRCHPDNHSLTCWKTHFNNLRDFVPFSRDAGYTGMILTSWSTSGIYGHQWDKPGEVLDLLPMRRVYPISGFNILLDTFAAAIASERPVHPRRHVEAYARDHLGLDPTGARTLWRALQVNETPASAGTNLRPLLSSAQTCRDLLAKLKPRRHREEVEHLKLMAELRVAHLRFKELEKRANSTWLTAKTIPAAIRALTTLSREAGKLDRKFVALNKSVLHPREIDEEIACRSKKLNDLRDRLSRAGRRHSAHQ